MPKSAFVWGIVFFITLSYWINLIIASFSISPLALENENLTFPISGLFFCLSIYGILKSTPIVVPHNPLSNFVWLNPWEEIKQHRFDLRWVALIACLSFVILAVVWGVSLGGDSRGYLTSYVQLDETEPPFFFLQIYWPPGSGLFYGLLLELGGGVAVTLGNFFLFLTASSAIFLTAIPWGRYSAWFFVGAWWLYWVQQEYFHLVGAEALTTWFVIGWMLTMRWAFQYQFAWLWLLGGAIIGASSLIRAGNFLLLAFLPIIFILTAARLKNMSLVLFGFAIFVIPYMFYNYVRYDEFTLARGGNALWFSAAYFTEPPLVQPENGKETRRLLNLVESNLLTTSTYQDITIKDYLNYPSSRLQADTIALVDRAEGWQTEYRLLQAVGFEAVRQHPVQFIQYRTTTLLRMLVTRAPLTNTQLVTETSQPEVVEGVYSDFLSSNPKGTLPSDESLAAITQEVDALVAPLKDYQGSARLRADLDWLWQRFGLSPLLMWGFVLVSLMFYQGVTRWYFIGLLLGLLAITAPSSVVLQIRYRVPFDGILLLFHMAGYLVILHTLAALQSKHLQR